MIKVGITGGIGSGKTTICRIFEYLGISVYYADSMARKLMENDESIIKEVKRLFGDEAYEKDMLNRSHISKIVFNDKIKLEQLNNVVHPAVTDDSKLWMERHKKHDYVIKEAALLIQSGAYKHMDFVVLVVAPKEIRIKRVVERDKVDVDAVEKRILSQWSETEMSHFADYSIINDGNNMLIPQVLQLHHLFKNLAKSDISEKA